MELSGGKIKIEEFNSGVWEQGFKYKYFVPAFINHPFSWEDDAISALLEIVSSLVRNFDPEKSPNPSCCVKQNLLLLVW